MLYATENAATNFERAVTAGSTTTRVHFTLSEPTPPPASQVRLSVDLIAGGWWDAAAAAGGAGFGNHDVALNVNGIEVWSQIDSAVLVGAKLDSPEIRITPSVTGNSWYLAVKGYNTRAKVERVK